MKKFVLGLAITAGFSVGLSQAVRAEGPNSPEMQLKRAVETAPANVSLAPAKAPNLTTVLALVRNLEANPEAQPKACAETKMVPFAGRYAISYDKATDLPCRIYDLTFPTLSQFWSAKTVSKIPVQAFSAMDYLNWMRGNYAAVYKQVDSRKDGFNASAVVPASWVAQLKFRPGFRPVDAKSNKGTSLGLPASFRASDLDVGDFSFSANQKSQLMKGAQVFAGSDKALGADMMKLAANPRSILDKLKFVWNDLEKVYDIVLEGEFLPISGPISLVDFNNSYKHVVERMVRTAILNQIRDLANLIPNATVRAVVSVGLGDAIDFANMMYQDRANQLEDVLRSVQSQDIRTTVAPELTDRALNILFGINTDLVSQYLTSVLGGKNFDWKIIEKLGYTARYNVEKQREIRRNTLNNNLVQKEGCSVTVMHDSFMLCSKNGVPASVRSIISQDAILFWDLGALTVYNYSRPSEVVLKRGTSWLLSAGLRVFKIPLVPQQIVDMLVKALRDYSVAGMTNEASLRTHLITQKWMTGSLQAQDGEILKWLYYQNINPFLPKTENYENQIIQTNAARIGMSYETLVSTK